MARPDTVVVNDDEDDDYEPLFSYSRVVRKPAFDEVDSDDDDVKMIDNNSWLNVSKRGTSNSIPSHKVSGNAQSGKAVKETKIDDDEDDWLPSPPKSFKTVYETEDPTVRQLRKEREEIMKLTASSEAALEMIEQERKNQSNNSEETSNPAPHPVPVASKREKILLSIQSSDGSSKSFRIFKDDKFQKLFNFYSGSAGVPAEKLVFMFDGEKVSADITPKDLDLEDEDIIEVNLKR